MSLLLCCHRHITQGARGTISRVGRPAEYIVGLLGLSADQSEGLSPSPRITPVTERAQRDIPSQASAVALPSGISGHHDAHRDFPDGVHSRVMFIRARLCCVPVEGGQQSAACGRTECREEPEWPGVPACKWGINWVSEGSIMRWLCRDGCRNPL